MAHLRRVEQPTWQCMDEEGGEGRLIEQEAACGAGTPRLRAIPYGVRLWCPAK